MRCSRWMNRCAGYQRALRDWASPAEPGPRGPRWPALGLIISVLLPPGLGAQEHQPSHGQLHFAHPLISESVTPDTKVRLDYRLLNGARENRSIFALHAEYALARSLSLEVGVPYALLDRVEEPDGSGLGSVEIALKLASFAFADRGVLLGYGIAFGLPTADAEDGIGSDHIWELEPFLAAGYSAGRLEAVTFANFGIPTNQHRDEPVETELGYSLSLLYHLGHRLQARWSLMGCLCSAARRTSIARC